MKLSSDLLDAAVMGDETTMHELLQQLREHDPVSRVEHPDFEPFWAITKHEDIKAISQNNAAFISSPRTVLIQREFEKALFEKFGTRHGVETLIHMDNPKAQETAQCHAGLVQTTRDRQTERGH